MMKQILTALNADLSCYSGPDVVEINRAESAETRFDYLKKSSRFMDVHFDT